MKLKILSDLHLVNISDFKYQDNNEDIIILAGDIIHNFHIFDFLIQLQKLSLKTVVFVPGNHEYYSTSKCLLDNKFIDFKHKNIHILNRKTVKINDYYFIGATGWSDGSFNDNGYFKNDFIKYLNDFNYIAELKYDPQIMLEWGTLDKEFFELQLHKHRNDNVVCISHNFPHKRSLDKQFKNSSLNIFFGNHWEKLIKKYNPKLWIHGHTHTSFDYITGKTRVVCNPFGYQSYQENTKFKFDKIIEIR